MSAQTPEEVLAQLDRIRADAQARGGAASRFAQRAQRLQVEAWSPRREVRIVLDSGALAVDVEFSPAAISMSPQALERAFLKAHEDALRSWQRAMDEIAAAEFADDPQLLQTMVDSTAASMPAWLAPLGE